MSVILSINGQKTNSVYLGWVPQLATLSLSPAQAQPVNVILKAVASNTTGNVQFMASKTVPGTATLAVTVPANGTLVNFFVAGFKASSNDQDLVIVVADAATGTEYTRTTAMVRVRKNANLLSASERDRFLGALMKFNLSVGTPKYEDFLTMHDTDADTEIHTRQPNNPRCSFLPWHRAFVLDLERQLQKIDPSVMIPYWKFDEPAPHVFSPDFMGAFSTTGSLVFNASNPLLHWVAKGRTGIIRQPRFLDQTSSPAALGLSADTTVVGNGNTFLKFRIMEGDPHGYAHTSFSPNDVIYRPQTATQDPIFFLLHANVDRIWALWQKTNEFYDFTKTAVYQNQGKHTASSRQNVGDYTLDTMWPWDGDSKAVNPSTTRPPSAPGGKFPQNTYLSGPTDVPEVWELIDYMGYLGKNPPIMADYDKITY